MADDSPFGTLPVVDVAPLRSTQAAGSAEVARQIEAACREHRVRNASGRDRFSFPFFFDPDFTAEIPPLPGRAAIADSGQSRWDGQNLQAHRGTYGDYLLGKVGKVFPQLRREVLTDGP